MAGTYYPIVCDNVSDHYCDPCEVQELGRVRSAAFIAADFQFLNDDPTNPTEWERGINERKIFIIPFTHGEVPLQSPKMGPGFGETVETLIAYDFTAKYFDKNFASNCQFYNEIKKGQNYYWAYRTSTKTYITDKTVTIIPGYAVQDDLTSLVNWEVGVKWQSPNFPCPFATPTGVFDECFLPAA